MTLENFFSYFCLKKSYFPLKRKVRVTKLLFLVNIDGIMVLGNNFIKWLSRIQVSKGLWVLLLQ